MWARRVEGIIWTVLLTVLLCAPHFNANIGTVQSDSFKLDKIIAILAVSFVASAFLSRMIFIVAASLLLLINVVYLHITLHWGYIGFTERVTVALESPPRESLEYLSAYADKYDALVLLYAVACIVLMVVVCKQRKPSNLWFRALSPAPIVIVVYTLMLSGDSRMLFKPIIGIPREVYEHRVRKEILEARNDLISNRPERALMCEADIQTAVIIIGESATSDRNPLYGFRTHWESQLADVGILKINAIAPTNQTRLSVPIMLTDAKVGDFDKFFSTHSLVTDLQDCGFKTYWLSNQHKFGGHDDYITSIAKETGFSVFISTDVIRNDRYDEALLEHIHALRESEGKQAFFVHLIGSHAPYEERFPKSFAQPTMQRIVDYDHSLRYTDAVLRQLFDMLPKDGLLFAYASDHGDVFVDVDNHRFGHGFNPAYKGEYNVPFLVFSTDAQRMEQLTQSVHERLINTESFDDILRFMVGLEEQLNVSERREVAVVAADRIVHYDDLLVADQQMDTPAAQAID